jgi:hypothetical protein
MKSRLQLKEAHLSFHLVFEQFCFKVRFLEFVNLRVMSFLSQNGKSPNVSQMYTE